MVSKALSCLLLATFTLAIPFDPSELDPLRLNFDETQASNVRNATWWHRLRRASLGSAQSDDTGDFSIAPGQPFGLTKFRVPGGSVAVSTTASSSSVSLNSTSSRASSTSRALSSSSIAQLSTTTVSSARGSSTQSSALSSSIRGSSSQSTALSSSSSSSVQPGSKPAPSSSNLQQSSSIAKTSAQSSSSPRPISIASSSISVQPSSSSVSSSKASLSSSSSAASASATAQSLSISPSSLPSISLQQSFNVPSSSSTSRKSKKPKNTKSREMLSSSASLSSIFVSLSSTSAPSSTSSVPVSSASASSSKPINLPVNPSKSSISEIASTSTIAQASSSSARVSSTVASSSVVLSSSSSLASSSAASSSSGSASSSASSSSAAPSATGTPPSIPGGGRYPNAAAVFPANPSNATAAELANWWTDINTEYGFQGFSYSLENCPSAATIKRDFVIMARQYNARFVRLYMDQCSWRHPGYMTYFIDAAVEAKIGVYASIWFGFDGEQYYKAQLANYINLIRTDMRAAWVIRNLAIGSEPILDSVLPNDQLAQMIISTRAALAPYGISVALSDMPYFLGQAPQVMAASDQILPHLEPMYSNGQSWGNLSWPYINSNLRSLRKNANTGSKKIVAVQTGWASNGEEHTGADGVVLSVPSQGGFWNALTSPAACTVWKQYNAMFFWHTFSDDGQEGFGMVDENRQPKWSVDTSAALCV